MAILNLNLNSSPTGVHPSTSSPLHIFHTAQTAVCIRCVHIQKCIQIHRNGFDQKFYNRMPFLTLTSVSWKSTVPC